MTPIVRRATPADTDPIFCMGSQEPAFGVSPQIRFYEKQELAEWIAAPDDNLLLVLDEDGEIRGFLFCKVMSCHWAYLDNFYVSPSCRGHGHGHLLMQALLDLLREREIAYLSTLVAESDAFLSHYFEHSGLVTEKTYVWQERFVK
jgi:ribosomal protein S18 acetylase RimI-like enzyme